MPHHFPMKDFTPKDLRNEITELRTLMGTKPFWAKSEETRDAALKGLTHMYFTYDSSGLTNDEITTVAEQYMAVMNEYERRHFMILRLAIS